MYSAGNLPDHVTRYHHRYENRWLVPPARNKISWGNVLHGALFALSGAGIILSAVIMMQGAVL